MKKLIILFIVTILSYAVNAQDTEEVFKFMTTERIITKDGGKEWSKNEEYKVLVVFKGRRITLYMDSSNESYDITKFFHEETDKEGKKTKEFQAVDDDGDVCRLIYYSEKKEDGNYVIKVLCIMYEKQGAMFKLKEIDD